MTKRLSNCDIERHFFKKFQDAYVLLPKGVISYGDKPDIILTGTRTIGIEVTRFYLAPGSAFDSKQRQKPLRDEIVKAAQKIYQDNGGRGIELGIGFDPTSPITSARRKALPLEIADYARCIDECDPHEIIEPLQKPAEVEAVHFTGDDYSNPHWRVSQIFTYKNMSIDALEQIVRGKEIKSADYKPCDAYWLLILVDWTSPAQDQEIQIDGINISSNIFEKIIIYKPGFEHVVEVNKRNSDC